MLQRDVSRQKQPQWFDFEPLRAVIGYAVMAWLVAIGVPAIAQSFPAVD
jgi:hypothetical protein